VGITAYPNKMRDLKAFGAYENSVEVQASIELVKILQIVSKSPQRQSNATGLNPPLFSFTIYMSLV